MLSFFINFILLYTPCTSLHQSFVSCGQNKIKKAASCPPMLIMLVGPHILLCGILCILCIFLFLNLMENIKRVVSLSHLRGKLLILIEDGNLSSVNSAEKRTTIDLQVCLKSLFC